MRYFFHVRDDDRLIIDDVGLELSDLAAAEVEAIAAARGFKQDAALTSEYVDHQVIEVTDHEGKVLLTVAVKDQPPAGPRHWV